MIIKLPQPLWKAGWAAGAVCPAELGTVHARVLPTVMQVRTHIALQNQGKGNVGNLLDGAWFIQSSGCAC